MDKSRRNSAIVSFLIAFMLTVADPFTNGDTTWLAVLAWSTFLWYSLLPAPKKKKKEEKDKKEPEKKKD